MLAQFIISIVESPFGLAEVIKIPASVTEMSDIMVFLRFDIRPIKGESIPFDLNQPMENSPQSGLCPSPVKRPYR